VSLPDPLATVLRLMPEEWHAGGLQDADPLVRLWAVGHALGYLAGMSDCGTYRAPSVLTEALSALRSQAQREADRG